jgi:hypothetical protein
MVAVAETWFTHVKVLTAGGWVKVPQGEAELPAVPGGTLNFPVPSRYFVASFGIACVTNIDVGAKVFDIKEPLL